jgi:hypothetical protein
MHFTVRLRHFGKDYRNMVAEVHGCLGDLKERFPSYQGQGYGSPWCFAQIGTGFGEGMLELLK